MYDDPRTKEQEIDRELHPTSRSAAICAIVLLIGLLIAGAYTYWAGGSSPRRAGSNTPTAVEH